MHTTTEATPKVKVEPETMDMDEVAARLGIGRSLAYQLARDGRLPGVKRFGRRLVMPRARFRELLLG